MKKSTEQIVADAMRKIAAKLIKAYEKGERPSSLDVYDLQETLLAVADEIDKE